MFFVSFGVLSEFIGSAIQTLIRKNHRLFVNEVFYYRSLQSISINSNKFLAIIMVTKCNAVSISHISL